MKIKYQLRTLVKGKETLIPITAEEAKAEHQNTKEKAISHISMIRERAGLPAITDIVDGIEIEAQE